MSGLQSVVIEPERWRRFSLRNAAVASHAGQLTGVVTLLTLPFAVSSFHSSMRAIGSLARHLMAKPGRCRTEATIMNRQCSSCHRTFTRDDFFREESRSLEADRRAARLQGVHFFDYRCPMCGNEDVFLDVTPLEGETADQFEARKAELEAAARRVQSARLGVVVTRRDGPA
jgi:hypothetical protein